MINSFFHALKFLTIFPIPEPKRQDLKSLGRSTTFFPLVGLLLGLILVAFNFLLSYFLPHRVVNFLLVISLIILTRGIHLDGLADGADGFLVGGQKDEILKIMRDTRIGTFGTTALFLTLLLKFLLLDSLPNEIKNFALITMPSLGRWSTVYAAFLYPAARGDGLGKIFIDNTKSFELFVASSISLLIGIVCFGSGSIHIFAGLLLFTTVIAHFMSKRISGMTGDTLGAITELSEVWILLSILVLFSH
ncbi:MAG: adenosylcobinamide-GDP ribazoletransferase [Actinomycetota bacterium]|nr:adenosylcobinamide-GDP ribazoletransferase [Actinomycetota bacterium]MDI6822009.1 adenosylcobinamide-GDP ribazoletransferase [Actinomycetota bacterium]